MLHRIFKMTGELEFLVIFIKCISLRSVHICIKHKRSLTRFNPVVSVSIAIELPIYTSFGKSSWCKNISFTISSANIL